MVSNIYPVPGHKTQYIAVVGDKVVRTIEIIAGDFTDPTPAEIAKAWLKGVKHDHPNAVLYTRFGRQ